MNLIKEKMGAVHVIFIKILMNLIEILFKLNIIFTYINLLFIMKEFICSK